MKKLILCAFIVIVMNLLFSDDLTIYQSGRNGFGLVHASEQVSLEKGENRITLSDLTNSPHYDSFLLDSDQEDVELLFLEFKPSIVAAYDLYKLAEGKPITIKMIEGDMIKGILRSKYANNLMVSEHDSDRLHLIMESNISELIVDDLVDTESAFQSKVNLKLNSRKKQKYDLNYSYLTNNLSWGAIYQAIWNEKTKSLQISSQVVLENYCGKDFLDTKVKLIAGDIKTSPNAKNRAGNDQSGIVAMQASYEGALREAEISSFYLYELSTKIDLPQKSRQQFQLYPSVQVKAKDYFFYNTNRHNKNLQKTVTFENSIENGLGRPIPAGVIKMYTPDEHDQQLQFIGESNLEDTPKNQKVIITLGDAFDIMAEYKVVETNYYGDNSKSIRNQKHQVTLNNNSNQEAKILIHHKLYYHLYNVKDANFEYTRLSDDMIEISLSLSADSQKVLNWTQEPWK